MPILTLRRRRNLRLGRGISPALQRCRRTRTAKYCTCAATPRSAALSAINTGSGAATRSTAHPDREELSISGQRCCFASAALVLAR